MALGLFKIRCLGEREAQRISCPWYKYNYLEALRLFVLNKHHWPLEVVAKLQEPSLLQILHQEVLDLRLSDEEKEPISDMCSGLSVWPELQQHC
ncbi:hypothetical protein SB18R_03160 [Pseudomonas oryzihabitans]|nr:hypothetical protein SB9_12395 [Pseudomonas psychrotolerans]KTT78247.1 hypothetical protein SB18R_03160 [Pseudomonas psychrotolerans]